METQVVETGSVDEVSNDDYLSYSQALAKSLGQGHGVVQQRLTRFMELQLLAPSGGDPVVSNFAPFLFQYDDGELDQMERILINITVSKLCECIRVSYKSRCSMITGAQSAVWYSPTKKQRGKCKKTIDLDPPPTRALPSDQAYTSETRDVHERDDANLYLLGVHVCGPCATAGPDVKT